MTVLVLVLVLAGVLLWPRSRPVPGGRGSAGRGSTPAGTAAFAKVRRLLALEVRFRRSRRAGGDWVADFAELAAVGLDAGLPSAEAASLACAVGSTSGQAEPRSLAARLAAAEATGALVGASLRDAAEGDRDLTFLAAAWQLTDEFGVAAAPAARLAAEVLRERSAAHDRRTVLAAGPRASMWLLTLLPVSGPVVAILLGLPVGEVYGGAMALFATGAGLGLTAVGWLWSRGLLRRALRPAQVS